MTTAALSWTQCRQTRRVRQYGTSTEASIPHPCKWMVLAIGSRWSWNPASRRAWVWRQTSVWGQIAAHLCRRYRKQVVAYRRSAVKRWLSAMIIAVYCQTYRSTRNANPPYDRCRWPILLKTLAQLSKVCEAFNRWWMPGPSSASTKYAHAPSKKWKQRREQCDPRRKCQGTKRKSMTSTKCAWIRTMLMQSTLVTQRSRKWAEWHSPLTTPYLLFSRTTTKSLRQRSWTSTLILLSAKRHRAHSTSTRWSWRSSSCTITWKTSACAQLTIRWTSCRSWTRRLTRTISNYCTTTTSVAPISTRACRRSRSKSTSKMMWCLKWPSKHASSCSEALTSKYGTKSRQIMDATGK